MKKDKIYIGDLAYRVGGSPFPLGAGYMASMIDHYFENSFEITIFTDTSKLTHAIKNAPPKIVALANYSWNSNLNSQVIKYSKEISKKIISVLGGPYFAKNDKTWLKNFFQENEHLDFYISSEGEWKFAVLVKQARKHSYCTKNMIMDKLSPDIFYRSQTGEIVQGVVPLKEVLDHRYRDTRKKDLDTIKSPYLSGRLDQFFEIEDMIPMIETARGCPYACTFCCWGDPSLSRLSAFSDERVHAELDYIAKRSNKNTRLMLADANYGILKRDVLLAKYINKLAIKYGWPKKVYLYFAKNSPSNIVEIASLFGEMTTVSLARQTMNEDVLKNIKRKNIKDETFYKVQKQLSASNIDSEVEFIYPLPGETKQTFLDGINDLFKKLDMLRTEMRFHPTELLPGSEMATAESRKQYEIKSAWRRLYGSDKDFGDVSSCEYEEIITSTNTFSFSDFVYVRKLHFLICLFSTYKIYSPIVELYQSKSRDNSFIWFIDKLIVAMQTSSDLMAELFEEITSEIKNEFITKSEYNSKNSKLYQGGGKKRINVFYIFTLLYAKNGKYRQAFSELIKKVFVENSLGEAEEVNEKLMEINNNIIDYNRIQKAYEANDLEKELSEFSNSTIITEFIKCTTGNLLSTLDNLYNLTDPGRLYLMLLKNKMIVLKNNKFEKGKIKPVLEVGDQIAGNR